MIIRKPSFSKNKKQRVKYRWMFYCLKHYSEDENHELSRELQTRAWWYAYELSPIEIVDLNSDDPKLGINLSFMNKKYESCIKQHKTYIGANGKPDEWISDAIDKNEKTIAIKIHLDRQESAIIQDIKYLLDLVKGTAKNESLDLSSLKPRWKEYNLYVRIAELKDDEKKSWSQISKQLIKERLIEDDEIKDPTNRKIRLRYKRAKWMIEEAGKRI